MQQEITSFLGKLIDWKDFEHFVADLYKDSEELIVDHNVTEVGKSGAKRQIDVRVLQKSKLHTIKTIIECKRWKEKVDRQVIDVLASSVDDLNANKGAIFTTTGYEEGAIQYAKSKNIDIFIVRDIYESEWGKPGRYISLYLQYFNSKIDSLELENLKYFSPSGLRPTKQINIAFIISKDQQYPDHLKLYSLDDKKGPHLLKLILDIRNHLLSILVENFNQLLPGEKEDEIAFRGKIKIDFKNYPFKFLKHENGYVTFESISFVHTQLISQSKFDYDRANNTDFALIVENYITNQRNFASKIKGNENVLLSPPIKENMDINENEIVKNESIIKIIFEPYVSLNLKENTPINNIPDKTVNLATQSE